MISTRGFSHMAPLALLGVLAAACSSSSPPSNVPPMDMTMAGPSPDMAALPYYIPTGYQLVPFASTTPAHDFPMADMVLQQGKHYQAVIETDVGRMVLDLHETDTPITVNSMVFLALHHFYDGIAFHRVIDGFMAQTGDPNSIDQDPGAWGQGGPGYYFGLEIVASLKYDGAGVVGMARTNDPNSNGSQFFITFAAQPSLTGKYTIFAKVLEGLDVLPKIVRGTTINGMDVPPDVPTRMTRVYIVAK